VPESLREPYTERHIHRNFRNPNDPMSLPQDPPSGNAPPQATGITRNGAAEARLRYLASALGGFVYDWDVESGAVVRSTGLLTFLGYSPQEVEEGVGWWHARIHPDDLAGPVAAARDVFDDPASTRVATEYRVRRRDGEYRWVVDRAWLVRDERGRLVRVVGITTDVTAERAEREAASHAEAERLRLLESEREARRRTERLQRLSAELTRLLTPAEVAEVVVRQTLDAFGAFASGVVELSEDGSEFVLLGAIGFEAGLLRQYSRFSVDLPLPARDVVRTHESVFVGDIEDWRERYSPLPRPLPDGATDGAWVALPLRVEERLIGVLTISMPGPRDFADDERRFMRAFADLCAQALERAHLYEAASEAQARAEFLSEASRLLASSLDHARTLESVARAAVPRLGDWCAVDMVVDPASAAWPPTVQRLAVMHQDPARIEWARELHDRSPPDWDAPGGLPRVLREGVIEFYPSINDEMLVASARSAEELALMREIGFAAYISVPLVVRSRIAGAITLCMAESGRHYRPADRELAEELARRASLAIEHAELYREAQEANAAKSQFLAVMSHELRTPLNAIGGYTELLELGIHGAITAEQRAALERIQHSQRHLLGLINNVLNFARIEAGQVEYRIEPLAVDRMIAGAVDLVEPQARAKKQALEVDLCRRPVTVLADAEKLQQVLLNLLSNAVKYTSEGGRIRVACEPDGETASISVSDTGIGIPADRLSAVFEPFVQVNTGPTRSADGTGLGLAISRDLARAMGGDLQVESVLGRGSTFTLTLPTAKTSAGRAG
jgi:PAS domain S-box-containing protein